jgi:CMP-N-acetylneuraminic acid synthetase
MKTLITVLARAGSQRLKDKNILDFCGCPLLIRTIVQAVNFHDSDTIFSSDSDKYHLMTNGYPLFHRKRSADLSSNTASKIDAIRDAVTTAEMRKGEEYQYILDLAVTSPLRSEYDINMCLCALEAGYHQVRTGCYREFMETSDSHEKGWQINGAVYGWKRDVLMKKPRKNYRRIAMPAVRSVDIDTIEDFKHAEAIHEKGLHLIQW